MKPLPDSAIIIGAGVGGLGLANLLAHSGVKVTVCEQYASAGGRAGQLILNDFTFDTGPSWYLMPEVFEHYFALLGEDVYKHISLTRLTPAYRAFFDYALPMTIYADATRDRQSFEALEPGAGKALDRYLAGAGQAYDLAMKHFLYTNFQGGKALLRPEVIKAAPRLVKMLTSAVDRYVRQFVSTPQLQQVLEYPMVFLGASPYNAPAMYSLMSHMDFTQGVFYPQGGMYALVKALTAIGTKAGVKFRYNTPVKAILTRRTQVSGVELQSGEQLHAEVIVSNADLHFTETKLVPPQFRAYPEKYWQKRIPSPSALLIYLGIKGKLTQLSHHNLFFTKDWRANFDAIYRDKEWPYPASMYVCCPSATDSSVAPKNHENLFVLVPVPARAEAGINPDAYADRYLRQLAGIAGIVDLKKRIVARKVFTPNDFASHFNAWSGTALGLAHTLRQSALLRPSNRSRKLANLYYVGASTVPGIGLPMCLIGAEVLYKRLIGDRLAGPLTAPLPKGKR